MTKLGGSMIEEASNQDLKMTRKLSIKPELPEVQQKAILDIDGKKVEIPILTGTDGVQMLDI